MPPQVSVIMAVYNSAAYISEAMQSVVEQRGIEWECIVVDDGSTDGTSEILDKFARKDKRIQVIRQKNAGQSAALNKAIELSTAPWLARLDGDDIFMPGKLKTHFDYLQAHPDIDICGTWCESFGANQKSTVVRFPERDADIRAMMLFQCPLMHPSTMVRKKVLTENALKYRSDACNDYDLWIRALPFVKFANMPRVLTRYRVHSRQLTAHLLAENYYGPMWEVMRPLFQMLCIDPTMAEFENHVDVGHFQCKATIQFLETIALWFTRLLDANRKVHAFPEKSFIRQVEKRFWFACNVASELGIEAWTTYWHSEFRSHFKPSSIEMAKFALKCGVRHLRRKTIVDSIDA